MQHYVAGCWQMGASNVTTEGNSLDDALASPVAKFRHVRRLFATIADRYDLITRLLSFGRDGRWKRRAIEFAGVKHGSRVLDLACGTGDLALLASGRGASVVGLDLTHRMVVLARAKPGASVVSWVVGDMCALPIPDAAFDVITTGYGLRNVPDLERALRECVRVLRPGGVLCSLDFDRPEPAWLRAPYLAYLRAVGGLLGWVLHRDPDTYRYIPASIARYPGARRVTAMMEAAGLREVRHVPVLGGLMAIHVATKG